MRRLNCMAMGAVCLALGSAAAAQAQRRQDYVEHSLGRLEVAGACPAVPSRAQQIKQGRALSWQAGRVDVDVKLFTSQPLSDRKSRLQLRDCTASVSNAVPKELLAAVSHEAETALVNGINQCLKGAGSDVSVLDASLRRSAPACS